MQWFILVYLLDILSDVFTAVTFPKVEDLKTLLSCWEHGQNMADNLLPQRNQMCVLDFFKFLCY